jgi:hypothetical protein
LRFEYAPWAERPANGQQRLHRRGVYAVTFGHSTERKL